MKDINEYLDAKTVIIIVLACLAIMLSVLSFRQWKSISDISGLIDTEAAKNESYQDEINALRKKRDEDAAGDDGEAIYKLMPPEPDEAGLIAGIDKLCRDTSSSLRDITFLARNEHSDYLEVPFKVTLHSDYFALVRFLEGLGASERFIQLTSLDITADEETKLLNISISASAFSYKK